MSQYAYDLITTVISDLHLHCTLSSTDIERCIVVSGSGHHAVTPFLPYSHAINLLQSLFQLLISSNISNNYNYIMMEIVTIVVIWSLTQHTQGH